MDIPIVLIKYASKPYGFSIFWTIMFLILSTREKKDVLSTALVFSTTLLAVFAMVLENLVEPNADITKK